MVGNFSAFDLCSWNDILNVHNELITNKSWRIEFTLFCLCLGKFLSTLKHNLHTIKFTHFNSVMFGLLRLSEQIIFLTVGIW